MTDIGFGDLPGGRGRRMPLVTVLFTVAMAAMTSTLSTAAEVPSNTDVEERVDRITEGSAYRWLRESRSEEAAVPDPQRRPRSGSGTDRRSEDGGCGVTPSFGEMPHTSSEADGCDYDPSLDCDCLPGAPDCGGAFPAHCGGTVSPSVGMLAGYLVAATLLCLFVVFVLRMLRGGSLRSIGEGEPDLDIQVEPPDLSTIPDPAHWMQLARNAALDAAYRRAVRFAYLSGILWLSQAGYVDLRESTTNLDIVRSTRHRNGPAAAVARLVRHFEALYFGGRPATQEMWEDCRVIVETELTTPRAEAQEEI